MIPSSFQKKVGLLISRNLTILETLGVTKATSKTVSTIPTCFQSVQTFTKRIRSRRGRSTTKTMINLRIIEVTTIVSNSMINFFVLDLLDRKDYFTPVYDPEHVA